MGLPTPQLQPPVPAGNPPEWVDIDVLEAVTRVQQNSQASLLLAELNGTEYPVTGWVEADDWVGLAKAQHPELREAEQTFTIVFDGEAGLSQDEARARLLASESLPEAMIVWGELEQPDSDEA